MCICIICNSTDSELSELTQIDCYGCLVGRSFPYLKNLRSLYLSHSNTTSLPNMLKLRYLGLSDCYTISEIPTIDGLEELYCKNCPKLSKLPSLKGLKKLFIFDCPNLDGPMPDIPDCKIRWLPDLDACDKLDKELHMRN